MTEKQKSDAIDEEAISQILAVFGKPHMSVSRARNILLLVDARLEKVSSVGYVPDLDYELKALTSGPSVSFGGSTESREH